MIEEELLKAVIDGATPPERYKLNDDKTALVEKSEEEIMADDWNSCIERRAEYTNYLLDKIAEMNEYLSKTDWYVSRKAETGKDIPDDIVDLRAEYRDKISDFRNRLSNANE